MDDILLFLAFYRRYPRGITGVEWLRPVINGAARRLRGLVLWCKLIRSAHVLWMSLQSLIHRAVSTRLAAEERTYCPFKPMRCAIHDHLTSKSQLLVLHVLGFKRQPEALKVLASNATHWGKYPLISHYLAILTRPTRKRTVESVS